MVESDVADAGVDDFVGAHAAISQRRNRTNCTETGRIMVSRLAAVGE